RNLADEPAGVGKAGLYTDALTVLDVVAIGFFFDETLHDARAVFKTRRRFKKRRDVGDVIYAEELGEEDRDQHGCGRFTLGDQEADRRFLVDVLLNLGDQRELAYGGCRLEIERREVDGLARAVLDHFDDARQRLAFGQIARPRLVHVGAEGVV